eukprot:899711-Rhodomonas_salina.2
MAHQLLVSSVRVCPPLFSSCSILPPPSSHTADPMLTSSSMLLRSISWLGVGQRDSGAQAGSGIAGSVPGMA